jgi:hypothetical protein
MREAACAAGSDRLRRTFIVDLVTLPQGDAFASIGHMTIKFTS